MDEFAQTRPQDDLFDDELVPVALQQQYVSKHAPGADAGGNGDGGGAATGGRQPGRQEKGREQGRVARREARETTTAKKAGTSGDIPKSSHGERRVASDIAGHETKPAAVRGDRSGTGGVKPKRLTEQELAARLESARLRSAAREEAHRRAEADEASFKEREQVEAIKRHEERANRREMDSERERNRARKMKALQGREWDANKTEDHTASYADRGGAPTRYARGGHGGPYDRRQGPAERGSGPSGAMHSQFGRAEGDRRRGYHGGRPRGGPGDAPRGEYRAERGRGGRNDGSGDTRHKAPQPPPDTAAPNEFPALPPSTHKDESSRPSPAASTFADSIPIRSKPKDGPHSRHGSAGGGSSARISAPSSKRQSLAEQGGASGPTAPTDKEDASKEKPPSKTTSPQHGTPPPATTSGSPPNETWADQVESAK